MNWRRGDSIIATMKNPSASIVSKTPWSRGTVADSSVIAMIAAAGTTIPASASRMLMSVTVRTPMMTSATPADAATAAPSGMNSCAKYISG